jgi:hypothetical protein
METLDDAGIVLSSQKDEYNKNDQQLLWALIKLACSIKKRF